MHRLLSTVLYTFIILTAVAQCGFTSPDLGYYAARDDCGFNKTEPDGTLRYGYTLYPYADGRKPDCRGWCKLLAQGSTRIWNDTNGDKVKDAGETRDCNYYIWYKLEVHTQCASYLQSAIRPDGTIEGELQTMRTRYADHGLASVSVGDAAGAKDGVCEFLRGPYSAWITVRAEMQVENSKYVVEDKTYIPSGIEDSAKIAEECNKASRAKTDEAIRLATAMCARWEETYKYSVSLARDIRPFIPRKADVPKDLAVNISSPSKDEPSIYALVYYKQPDSQFYGLEIAASTMDVGVSYNGALAQAKDRFKQEARKLKKTESITLPGADEAVRTLFRSAGSNSETIVFRVKNVYVRVWGSIKAKSLAPTRAAIIAKAVCAKMAGAQPAPLDTPDAGGETVELKANPASAWADGTSKINLILIAKDSAGKPIPNASFDIEMESNLLGKCEDVKMITDASGKATSVYVPTKLGTNTVTVKGEAGSASVKIGQGGLVIAQEDSTKTSVLADGKTKIGLKVTCLQPNGQPLSGIKIVPEIQSKEVSSKGILEPANAITGSDGTVRLSYTAPQLDPTSGTRAADIYVIASANVGNPARAIKATERISLYAGECVYLSVEKPGFTTIEKQAVGVQAKNGTIAGMVITRDDKSQIPVNCAKITVIGKDGKQLAEATTDTEGKFEVKFVGDITSPSDSKNEIAKSIEMEMNADLTNRVKECRKDLDELRTGSYDVASATSFTDDLVERLAKSVPTSMSKSAAQPQTDDPAPKKKKKGILGALDKLSDGVDKLQKKLDKSQGKSSDNLISTEYLMNAYPRLAWSCRYAKLLNERQCESADWLSDNVKAGLGNAMDVFSITDKIHDAAKSKLKDKFAGTDWEKYSDNVLADFVDIMYDQFQKGIDMAKTMNYDTGDIENFKKFGLEWASKKTVDGVTEGVKLTLQKLSHKDTQEMLTKTGGTALRGEMSSSDYTPDSDKALDLFTTFEKEHNKQNITNCNTEHYRLGTKLFIDTFVKGPMIYFNMKKLVMNPEMLEKIAEMDTKSLEEIQDKFIKNGDLASKMGSAVDSMFQGYQGYNWIVDYCRANTARSELTKLLVK